MTIIDYITICDYFIYLGKLKICSLTHTGNTELLTNNVTIGLRKMIKRFKKYISAKMIQHEEN